MPGGMQAITAWSAPPLSGLLAPAGTPPPLIARLNREVTAILRGPDIRDRLAADSAEVVAGSPEQLGDFVKSELAKWSAAAKASGARVD